MSKKLITYFNSEENICSCVEELLLKSISIVDILTPYPIKKFDEISLTKKSRIPFYTLIGAVFGFLLSMCFQYWTSAFDYKLNVSGKSFFSILYSVPVTIEVSIFFAAIFAFISFLIFSKLPKWYSEYDDSGIYDKKNSNILILVIEYKKKNEGMVNKILEKWDSKENRIIN